MTELKHIRCHWCDNELELIDDFVLECTKAHATIIFNHHNMSIKQYMLFYDVNPIITTHESLMADSIRYKISGYDTANVTTLFRKRGRLDYQSLIDTKYVPLKIEGTVVQMEPILLKTFNLFIILMMCIYCNSECLSVGELFFRCLPCKTYFKPDYIIIQIFHKNCTYSVEIRDNKTVIWHYNTVIATLSVNTGITPQNIKDKIQTILTFS